jgi:hypothetical protein
VVEREGKRDRIFLRQSFEAQIVQGVYVPPDRPRRSRPTRLNIFVAAGENIQNQGRRNLKVARKNRASPEDDSAVSACACTCPKPKPAQPPIAWRRKSVPASAATTTPRPDRFPDRPPDLPPSGHATVEIGPAVRDDDPGPTETHAFPEIHETISVRVEEVVRGLDVDRKPEQRGVDAVVEGEAEIRQPGFLTPVHY